jgi:hypothetical protein
MADFFRVEQRLSKKEQKKLLACRKGASGCSLTGKSYAGGIFC